MINKKLYFYESYVGMDIRFIQINMYFLNNLIYV